MFLLGYSTCECITKFSTIGSYVRLPWGRNQESNLVSYPNIRGRVTRGDLQDDDACEPCTGINCPKYAFCARVIYRRERGLYNGPKSSISFMAYNFEDSYYLVGSVLGPYFIGDGTEDSRYLYYFDQDIDLRCNNFDVSVSPPLHDLSFLVCS